MDLRNNRYSSQYRLNNDKQDDWFAAIDRIAYMWDRSGPGKLRAHVDVDKYFELESAVQKLGGAVISKKLDKVAGKYFVEIKEPKYIQLR